MFDGDKPTESTSGMSSDPCQSIVDVTSVFCMVKNGYEKVQNIGGGCKISERGPGAGVS